MSGQSITDRINAAKHSLTGQGLARIVCKATTEEYIAPKKKHVDYLVQCTNEPNVSIPQMANLLIERVHGKDWIVVYKSLITIHNLINFGNERFTQYLASNNCSFELDNFQDKNAPQASHMFKFITRYSRYIHQKSYSYRMVGYDFCKVKRGKDDGVLRTMNGEKLLKTLPTLQSQLDALVDFDASVSDLGNNSIIYACFIILFKDLIRLFACYNDGIINLLETYFEMNKKQCKEALDIYKRFLVGMDRVGTFLKLAENMGVDKGDIPDLAKAPASLLEALESHLASLEGKLGSTTPTGQNRPAGFASAIDNFSKATSPTGTGYIIGIGIGITDEEKRKALEDENQTLNLLNQKKATSPQGVAMAATNPFAASPTNKSPTQNGTAKPLDDLLGLSGPSNPFVASSASSAQPASSFLTNDLFSAPAPRHANASPFDANAAFGAPAAPSQTAQSPFQDNAFAPLPTKQSPMHTANLFDNNQLFGSPAQSDTSASLFSAPPTVSPSHAPTGFSSTGSNPWGTPAQPALSGFQGSQDVDFSRGFGMSSQTTTTASDFDAFGPVLAPSTNPAPNKPVSNANLIGGDLDSSLASLVGNLGMGTGIQQVKKEHQWNASPNRGMMTGGANWAPGTAPAPVAAGGVNWNQPAQGGMGMQPMGGMQPMTGLQPSPIGGQPAPNPFQPMTQPTQQASNPDPFANLLN